MILLATSSEEAGLRGAKRYVKKHLAELKATPTYGIFLESTADERHLTAATGELFTGAKHDRGLVDMARKIAAGHGWPIKSKPIPLGATDAAAFSKKGNTSDLPAIAGHHPPRAQLPHPRGHAGARAA